MLKIFVCFLCFLWVKRHIIFLIDWYEYITRLTSLKIHREYRFFCISRGPPDKLIICFFKTVYPPSRELTCPQKGDHFERKWIIWTNHQFSGDMLVFRGGKFWDCEVPPFWPTNAETQTKKEAPSAFWEAPQVFQKVFCLLFGDPTVALLDCSNF